MSTHLCCALTCSQGAGQPRHSSDSPPLCLPNSQQLRNSKVSPCLVGAGLGSEPGVSLEANCAQTAVVLANYLFHMGSCEIVISNNNISQPNSMQDIVS